MIFNSVPDCVLVNGFIIVLRFLDEDSDLYVDTMSICNNSYTVETTDDIEKAAFFIQTEDVVKYYCGRITEIFNGYTATHRPYRKSILKICINSNSSSQGK